MADFENEAEEPTLARFLELITLQSATDGMNDEETVTLMTVHAAKGLEYPVVMVTGLEEEMFPYRGIDPSADPDELEEERRLAYVAFTRAREQLVLMWAPSRRVFGQPRIAMRSRFLDEIPVECIDARGRAPQPRYPSVRDDDGDSSYTVPEGGMNRPAWQHPQSRSGRPSASSNAHSGRFMGSPAASSSSRGPGGRSSAPPPPDRAPGESYVDRSEGDDAEGGTLRRGMRVRHAKYGVGTIETWSDGVPPKVTVSFVQYGTKQIVATYLSPV